VAFILIKLELRRLYHFHLAEGTVVGAGRRQTDGCTPWCRLHGSKI